MSPYQTRKYGHAFEAYRTRHAYVRQYGNRTDESLKALETSEITELDQSKLGQLPNIGAFNADAVESDLVGRAVDRDFTIPSDTASHQGS